MLGKTISPKRHLLGNNGLVEFPKGEVDLVHGFEQWVMRGFPHHVCVVEGRRADAIRNLAQLCDVQVMSNKGIS